MSQQQNDIKPTFSKTDYRRFLQTTPTPPDLFRLLAEFSDLLDWMRGEEIRVVGSTALVTASQTRQRITGQFQPIPAEGDEWELLAAALIDVSAIDVNDTVAWILSSPAGDVVDVPLNTFQAGLALNDGISINMWMYPTVSANNVMIVPFMQRGLSIRKIANTQTNNVLNYQHIYPLITTTATVGTRSFSQHWLVRRRQIG